MPQRSLVGPRAASGLGRVGLSVALAIISSGQRTLLAYEANQLVFHTAALPHWAPKAPWNLGTHKEPLILVKLNLNLKVKVKDAEKKAILSPNQVILSAERGE